MITECIHEVKWFSPNELQNCTKQNFIRFCDHLCIFLMVKVAGICSETQGCPLCKETYPHLVYIMEYEHSTRTISPSWALTPSAGRALQGQCLCHTAGSKVMDNSPAPPSLHSAERSETNQSAPSVDLWGLPGSRTAAGTRVRCRSEFLLKGNLSISEGPVNQDLLVCVFFNRAETMTHFS